MTLSDESSPAARDNVPFDGDMIVLSRCEEAEGIVTLELALPTADRLPSWDPGAHIDIVLPNGLTRQYSLNSSPEDGWRWRFSVLREPASRGGSEWIHEHALEGSTLRVRGPRNNFHLETSSRYVFIGGGIGITPLLPMVAAAHGSGAEWTLYYGGRTRRSMAFLDELARYGDRVVVTPQDESGLLDLATILSVTNESTLLYCCGPSGLIDAIEDLCRSWSAGALHVERFVANQQASDADSQPIEVELRDSGFSITVPSHQSILEAAQNAGVRTISSCTEGICGSCETPVLQGDVDHRDSVLSDEERAAGDIMMICISRAAGGHLALDL